MALTVESLTLELGRALTPLEQRLRGGEISLLFAEIGLPAPDTVLGAQRVSASIGAVADALAALPDALSGLANAIASGDAVEITRAGGRVVPIVQAVTAAIDVVAAEIDATAAAAGPSRTEVEAFAAEFAERLFGFALASYLERYRPVVGHLFTLLGIIEISAHAATPAAPAHVRRVLRFDRFAGLIEDPVEILAQVYGWGSAEFDWDELLWRLSNFLGRVSNFTFVQPGPPPFLRIAVIDVGPTDDPVPGVQAVLHVAAKEGLDAILPIGDTVALTAKSQGGLEVGAAIALLPPADLRVVPPSAQVSGNVRLGVQAPHSAGAPPIVILGVAGGSRVQAERICAAVGADLIWDPLHGRADGAFVIEASMDGGKVVLKLAGGDGFLTAILPSGPIELDANLLVRWSSATGLHFDGETGLHTTRGLHRELGRLRLDSLDVALTTASNAFIGTVTVTGAAALGPVTAKVESIGTTVTLRFKRGNLGLVDLSLNFKPPTGVGLAIEAPGVLGGGFLRFDPDKGQYSGAVELTLEGGIAVKGIGVIATRLPDGRPGYSLLIVITAEGFEPIPLPLGFRLTGIGGLLAVNRTFDEDVLRAGLKNHTLDSVLFPQDPIRNAPQILSNLNKVFPPAEGHYLLGPVAQIEWGAPTLLTAQVGLVLELGARLRLLVLAQIAALLPSPEQDLIHLQMDAVGVLDFDQGTAALDATLHDSRLLQKFVLTGDMAMRLKWGGSPNFALAVGGLHPAFNPPPNFPKLARIAINLAAGDNPRIRCEAYFALTGSSIQFGARAELYAEGAGFSIQGEIGFDVLIQRAPFAFLAEFYAQVQLKHGTSNLFKVRVEGALAGPRPLHVKAKATFEVLWWDVSIRVDRTLVAGETPPLPAPVDVLPLLLDALGQVRSWTARLAVGQRPGVTLRARPELAGEVLLHPLGRLTVSQTVVPLDMDIARFGDAAPAGVRRFTISRVSLGGQGVTPDAVREFFAPAQFFELSDDEKLSRPSFESLPAGVSLGSAGFAFSADPSAWLEVPAIQFETIIVGQPEAGGGPPPPQDLYQLTPVLLGKQASFGAAANSALRHSGGARYRTTAAGKHRLAKEGWSLVATDDLTVQGGPGMEGGGPASYSEAEQALRGLQQQDPAKAAGLKILRLSEVKG